MYTHSQHRSLCYKNFAVTALIIFLPNAYAMDDNDTETIVVTGIREARSLHQTAESVGVITQETIESLSPAHPAELLNRLPGVHINNIGGEGHMAAIRQPISTSAVYLYLEDGIPVRPTGFFNHNALYEVNLPQSQRIEIVKGPGSALYGSEAVGGIINSITQTPEKDREYHLKAEAGEYGWRQFLGKVGGAIHSKHKLLMNANLTDNPGYRDAIAYDRQSASLSLDSQWGDSWTSKTRLHRTRVDQSGFSSLEYDDYQNNPQKNLLHGDVGSRHVKSLRASSHIQHIRDKNQTLNITPYYRSNTMTLIPNWMINFDPNIRKYYFQSFGTLIKQRYRLTDSSLVIWGTDMDFTPSTYREDKIQLKRNGEIYQDFQRTGETLYDYEAEQLSLSPYIHSEWALNAQWRLHSGFRYDYFHVDYDNQLPQENEDPQHYRPRSQTLSFDTLSPKLGLVYQPHAKHSSYFNYRHAFVAPPIDKLFRSGSATNSNTLKPIKAINIELGQRGAIGERWFYELSIYQLQKSDDIVTLVQDDDRVVMNAGKTQHRGIELGMNGTLGHGFDLSLALTKTHQKYLAFETYTAGALRNFSGKHIAQAPETLANLSLSFTPPQFSSFSLQWEVEHLGQYYTDENNTQRYPGHNLTHLRISYRLHDKLRVYARGMNLTDKRYSTRTNNQVGRTAIQYRPGMPRTFYTGVDIHF